jgi:hypothetical protein
MSCAAVPPEDADRRGRLERKDAILRAVEDERKSVSQVSFEKFSK